MALNSRKILDPRWTWHNASVALGFQICNITIYNENLGSRTYNATTNTWTNTDTAIWAGKARIQARKDSSSKSSMVNPSNVREVQFQIAFNKNTIVGATAPMADLRPGNYIIVNTSPQDATLQTFSYIVKSVVNSSSPWQRTIIAEVDMESDPNA
jgi:hypothetical protein